MEAFTPEQVLERCLGLKLDEVEIDPDLKKLQGSARKISQEEKKERSRELEDMSISDIENIFGLD